MILRVEKLEKHFGGLKAVNKVSFGVEKGEIRSIIGPNGAGKTTVFNLICRILKCDAGRIIFKGEDITRSAAHTIRHLGLGRSFQRSNLFNEMTVFENIHLSTLAFKRIQNRGWKNALRYFVDDTLEVMELVNISHLKDKIAGRISHGDQRRLDVAITLVGNPSLVLLDEPTSGMSIGEKEQFINMLLDVVRKKRLSLLIIEHDMDTVFSISDRISVLHFGTIIADGLPEEIKENKQVREVYLGEI